MMPTIFSSTNIFDYGSKRCAAEQSSTASKSIYYAMHALPQSFNYGSLHRLQSPFTAIVSQGQATSLMQHALEVKQVNESPS